MSVIKYEPPINFSFSRELYLAARFGYACPECGKFLEAVPTVETFNVPLCEGLSYEVSPDCGLCPECLDKLRVKASRTVLHDVGKKIEYSFIEHYRDGRPDRKEVTAYS